MKPVLFTIGDFNVYAFGFFLCLSFILSTFLIWKKGKEELREEEYLDTFLYTAIVTLISARFFYIIFHFEDFGLNFLRFIVVRETPGLSLWGGLFGGITYLFYYCSKKKYNPLSNLDLFSYVMSFFLILAKIGEQLGGAGFGKETNFFLGVRIVGLSGRHHPVELYEAIIFLLIFVFLLFIYKKTEREKWPKGIVFFTFLLCFSITVFLLEFLKGNSVYLKGLSFRQWVAGIVFLVCLYPLFRKIKQIKFLKNKKL